MDIGYIRRSLETFRPGLEYILQDILAADKVRCIHSILLCEQMERMFGWGKQRLNTCRLGHLRTPNQNAEKNELKQTYLRTLDLTQSFPSEPLPQP